MKIVEIESNKSNAAKLIPQCHINTIEKGELLKKYVSISDNLKINSNSLYMTCPYYDNDKYIKIMKVQKYDKIYCPWEWLESRK